MTNEKRAFRAWPASTATRFIEDFEGRRLVAYQCSAGVWTLGVGHTAGVKAGDTCTDGQADEWLIADIRSVAEDLSRYINHDVTHGQYIALVSLAFNVGVSYVVHKCPKLMQALNAGDVEACAHEFLDIDSANGVKLPGLTRRRQSEARLFLGEGVPAI